MEVLRLLEDIAHMLLVIYNSKESNETKIKQTSIRLMDVLYPNIDNYFNNIFNNLDLEAPLLNGSDTIGSYLSTMQTKLYYQGNNILNRCPPHLVDTEIYSAISYIIEELLSENSYTLRIIKEEKRKMSFIGIPRRLEKIYKWAIEEQYKDSGLKEMLQKS